MKNKEKNEKQDVETENLKEEKLNNKKEESEMEGKKELKEKLKELKKQLSELTKENEDITNSYQRLAAEFDNYKRRTQKEKEAIYSDSVVDTIKTFLPVVDNFERALSIETDDAKVVKEGLEMIFRQMQDVMKNHGVSEIKAVGEKFDPQLHNAVMHDQNDEKEENMIVEEYQKGYKLKEKVIRHSMVKVVN